MPTLSEMAEEAAGYSSSTSPSGERQFEPLALRPANRHVARSAPLKGQQSRGAHPAQRSGGLFSSIGKGLGLFTASARKPFNLLG